MVRKRVGAADMLLVLFRLRGMSVDAQGKWCCGTVVGLLHARCDYHNASMQSWQSVLPMQARVAKQVVRWPGGGVAGGCGLCEAVFVVGERDRVCVLVEDGDCGFKSGVRDLVRDRVGDRGVDGEFERGGGDLDLGGGKCEDVRGRFFGGSRTVL